MHPGVHIALLVLTGYGDCFDPFHPILWSRDFFEQIHIDRPVRVKDHRPHILKIGSGLDQWDLFPFRICSFGIVDFVGMGIDHSVQSGQMGNDVDTAE